MTQNKNKIYGMLLFMTIIFILSIYGYISATKLFNENYTHSKKCNMDINGRLCRGGPYTWQGDSPRAKACRKLASTPEGQEQIQRFECGKGYTGYPGRGFKFTPLSNNNWENERCKDLSIGSVEDNGIF
jgi:hypothetical protein